MANAWLSENPVTKFFFKPLEYDEFIPLVEFDRANFKEEYGFLSGDRNLFNLSEHIDANIRQIEPKIIETEIRKIKLPFTVKKGCSKSGDSDGFVDIKLSISDPEVLLTGETSLKTSYGSSFELELEIKKNVSIDFDVDFYANDDADKSQGTLKGIHCGRVQVKFKYTVATDWETIAPVIPKSKFIGWNSPISWLPSGKTAGCFHYALEQLRQVKHWVKSEDWGTSKKMNAFIYQLYLEHDIAGMKAGVQKDQFEPGVAYLKKTLKVGIPVTVGVDDDAANVNTDKTTEHYITIVGMGNDAIGKHFLFYDNAVVDAEIGTSLSNKLYCNFSNFKIVGNGDPRNAYIQNQTTKKEYIVTQIRETK